MQLSKYQEAILEAFKSTTRNLQIEAKAGSGKTSTLEMLGKLVPADKSCCVVSFNREVQKNFLGRFPSTFCCKTLHSIGMQAIRDAGMWVKVNEKKVDNILKYEIFGYSTKSAWEHVAAEDKDFYWEYHYDVCKLVSLMKSFAPDKVALGAAELIKQLAESHGVDIPEGEEGLSFVGLIEQVYNLNFKKEKTIDFDDMLLFPLAFGLKLPVFDYVFVDEAQDLNEVQRMLITLLVGGYLVPVGSSRPRVPTTGRIIIVGDTNQSIYAFRGASTTSMDELSREFDPLHLPLSICYRCGEQIVKRAQKLVPEIEAAPEAKVGVVADIDYATLYGMVRAQDYILCRTNSPLISVCLKLINKGFAARVLGKDLGEALLNIIRKIQEKEGAVNHKNLNEYMRQEIDYLESVKKKRFLANRMKEYDEMFRGLASEWTTGDELRRLIQAIFAEPKDDNFVALSTIHRVKGQERRRVFIVRPDLIPHPMATQDWELQQERNLEYVAVTRAKEELYFVIEEEVKKK